MLGLGRRVSRCRWRRPTASGTLLALGTATPFYDGSEWQALVAGTAAGRIPEVDLPALRWLCDLLSELAPTGLVRSAHDVSDGGLAVALAELALAAGTGLDVTLDPGEAAAAAAVFGECCGLVVVSVAAGDEQRLAEACDSAGVPCERIGSLGGPAIALRCGELALELALDEAARGLRRRPPECDGGRLMCGVFGIHAPGRDVARLAYFALYALQHRGQESAGIAVSDGRRVLTVRDMGLVAQVFDEGKLQALPGRAAIGHARYSTTGSAHWVNSQPIVAHRPGRTVALGHNGNLTNTNELRAELQERGIKLASTSDTEVICALIANHPGTLAEGAVHAMERITGAFSAVVLSEDTLLAFRDPDGIRPLVLGDLDGSPVVASETPALDIIGATAVRELKPGELLICDSQGSRVIQAVPARRRETMCVFEHIYFARPDAKMDGQTLYEERERMGEQLAAEAPVEADVVIPVPDSGTPAAQGFARASGLPFADGLIKNRYVGRTLHPAEPGAARGRPAAQVQPAAARARRQARDRRRRLDRARHDDAQDRRRCCAARARARCTCASRPRRSSRPATTASTWRPRTS